MESATLDLTGDDEGASGGSCSEEDEPTQPYRDPDATQFIDFAFVEQKLGAAVYCELALCHPFFEDIDTTCCVVANKNIPNLWRVCVSMSGESPLSGIIELYYDNAYSQTWKSAEMMCLTGQTPLQFMLDLTLSYEKLSEIHLKLMFAGDRLEAVMTNTLVGPTQHEVMQFHCFDRS
jgi:hypothetical protein